MFDDETAPEQEVQEAVEETSEVAPEVLEEGAEFAGVEV
mgnify:CR=1 FL=1